MKGLGVLAALTVISLTTGGPTVVQATTASDTDGDGVPNAADSYPEDPRYAQPLTATVNCYDLDGALASSSPTDAYEYWDMTFVIDRVLLDFTEPWAMTFPAEARVWCKVVGDDGAEVYIEEPVTDVEQADWDATDPQYRQYTIGISYAQCVEHGTNRTTREWPISIGQAEEAIEAFSYCPGHPDRALVDARIEALGVDQAERDSGVRFGDGLYRVGVDVQPGHYFTESDDGFEACYWERQDSTGETLDNFFGRVFRAEVTIESTDYGFLSDGCGEWQLVE